MTKKFFLLIVAILMGGMTAVKAKINYVPLYIVDTTPDVTEPRRTPAGPLFITQDDHKLTLPEIDDSLTFMVFKDNNSVYVEEYQRSQPTVNLPATLIGDYEVRLCADTYYYYGYLTLELQAKPDIPTQYGNWYNITPSPQETILNSFMGLNVIEYDRIDDGSGQRYEGMLYNELKAALPQVTDSHYGFVIGDVNIWGLLSVTACCIQELKVQLDSRTEAIVDIMSRNTDPSAVREVRAAIGNTLLSAAPTSFSEPATIRYLLTDNVSNAYIAITDMGGRVVTKVPVSPSDTSAIIDSGTLGEGIFLCTLYANGENIGTKRLIKTK